MVSDVAISPDDCEGVVLAKVMEVAKEIRSDDKKRVNTGVKTPINRRPGWGPGGSVVCWGWLGGGDPAEVCGGNSAVFNQLLTTFLVVAMVWRLPVFFLCPYCLFWRALPGR